MTPTHDIKTVSSLDQSGNLLSVLLVPYNVPHLKQVLSHTNTGYVCYNTKMAS